MPDSNMDNILGNFAQFSGGVEVRPETAVDVQHVAADKKVSVSVPHINGDLPGEVAGVDFWVDMRQLELAPPEDLLHYRYDPKEDKDFEALKQAITDLGDRAPTLMAMPANRDIMVGSKLVHVYRVYDEPAIFYALKALNRAKARIELVIADSPSALLLLQLSKEGQLRREPSVLEECRTVRRLHLHYKMTLDEICSHLARDREDHTKLSVTQAHYMVIVAGLPEEVQDLLHNKNILWSHARMIAAEFGDDEESCILLAKLASQGKRMTVEALDTVIRQLSGKLCRMELDESSDVVHVVKLNSNGLKLVDTGPGNGPSASAAFSDVPQYPTLLAKPAMIRKEASRFEITVVMAATPDKTAITPASFDPLRQWLSERRTNTTMRDTEAVLYGFIEAMRRQAAEEHLTNAAGQFGDVVDGAEAQ